MARPLRTVFYVVLLLWVIVWLAGRTAPALAPTLPGAIQHDVRVPEMEEALTSLRASVESDPGTIVVLGDSALLDHLVLGREDTLASMLEREAPRAGLAMRVLAYPGFDSIAYYLLVDELAALRPRAVVLIANLQAFTDSWFRAVRLKHPQLAAFVRPSRMLEAMALPLERASISDAMLALKPALRVFGASDLPEKLDAQRQRFRDAFDRLLRVGARTATRVSDTAFAADVDGAAMPAPTSVPSRPFATPANRPTPGSAVPSPNTTGTAAAGNAAATPPSAHVRIRPGDPTMAAFQRADLYPNRLQRDEAPIQLLAATVRDLVARDVRTIVVVLPLHMQALQATGAYRQRDLAGAIALIGDVVTAGGGTAIDLTKTLPQESYFTDEYTHFGVDGNRIVTTEILAEVRRALGEAR